MAKQIAIIRLPESYSNTFEEVTATFQESSLKEDYHVIIFVSDVPEQTVEIVRNPNILPEQKTNHKKQ